MYDPLTAGNPGPYFLPLLILLIMLFRPNKTTLLDDMLLVVDALGLNVHDVFHRLVDLT